MLSRDRVAVTPATLLLSWGCSSPPGCSLFQNKNLGWGYFSLRILSAFPVSSFSCSYRSPLSHSSSLLYRTCFQLLRSGHGCFSAGRALCTPCAGSSQCSGRTAQVLSHSTRPLRALCWLSAILHFSSFSTFVNFFSFTFQHLLQSPFSLHNFNFLTLFFPVL